ncbi:MAG: alkaline phosphatase family protein, partial [Mycobacteriales bacterium]
MRRTVHVGGALRTLAVLPVLLLVALLPAVVARPASAVAHGGTAFRLPPVRHIFVIMLENEGYAATFDNPSADPYLARTLPAAGALLEDYYATGHVSNDNYISFVSGQAPNPSNQSDCQYFTNVTPGTKTSDGQANGSGCVYPSDIGDIGTQLTTAGLAWKGYDQDMGNDPSRESAACGHPAIVSQYHTQSAGGGDGYVTRHDPFVYFHGVIDNQAYCDAHVVALGSPSGAMPRTAVAGETGLATDLRSAATTPAFSFITPNVCSDGHDYPCTNSPSGSSALADIDAFLQTWVPLITHSAAFRASGLLEITFDESSGPQSDSSACCGETPGPSSAEPGISGPGGGLVGAVLLSPFIRPGTVSQVAYNHYSSLATIEDLLGVSRLGEAASVTSTFGADVFAAKPAGAPNPSPAVAPTVGGTAPAPATAGATSPGTSPGTGPTATSPGTGLTATSSPPSATASSATAPSATAPS